MMQKVIRPQKSEWPGLLARPEFKREDLTKICEEIFTEVMKRGDRALAKYTWFFDKVKVENFRVSDETLRASDAVVSQELKNAIRQAKEHIEAFHVLQKPERCEYVNPHGFRCWQEPRGIEKVGLYIPGGSAPLFSTVLMLAVPARIAGCREIVLCTPPGRSGEIDPAVLWTAGLCGVTRIYKVGGVQAIAAMTFGTESVPQVYKIFGPGNQYVTAAKQLACHYGMVIDMPAGPSEIMIVADRSARPDFVAADLLSQAEHGVDSQVILVTPNEELLGPLEIELQRQLNDLPRREIVLQALTNSKCIVLRDIDECIAMANAYAPEHLMLCVEHYDRLVAEVVNAGSVFLGNYSPESAGDYASGTNHTLPTNAYAKACSGVNVDAFVRKITFQEITRQGLEYLGKTIEVMAENEQLAAHRNAVAYRLK